MTLLKDVLDKATGFFAGKGLDSPRLEAELLLAHVLDMPRIRLYMEHERPLAAAEVDAYRELVRRRAGGEPAAYLVGTREFYGLPFAVTPAVLIPRPETELLVDAARKHRERAAEPDVQTTSIPVTGPRVLDLGTGSGVLAVCLARHLAPARVTAVDISAEALAVAAGNADRLLGPGHGIEFVQAEAGVYLAACPAGAFDLVVSNPPYVTAAEYAALDPGVRDHEPRLALAAGADGLDVYRSIFAALCQVLAPGALVLLECSDATADGVAALATAAGLPGEVLPDYAGHRRVFRARQ